MKTTFSTLILVLGLMSCNNNSSAQQTDPPKEVKHIKVSELSELAKVNNTIFLDVRTPEEFLEGYIPNATHIDFYSDDFQDQIQKLDKSKAYIVYCKSGMRSQQASKLMSDLGFVKVYNLIGGYDAWKK